MPLRETVLMMRVRAFTSGGMLADTFLQVFDEIRQQGQLVYPEALETLDLYSA